MKYISFYYLSLFLLFTLTIQAQVGIHTKKPKVTLEIGKMEGTIPQGLLLPSLTQDEIDSMQEPIPNGTLVYNETKQCLHIYKTSVGWECVENNKQSFSISYLGAEGVWVKNITTNDKNIVRFKIINNLDIPITGLYLNHALTLPNVSPNSYDVEPLGWYDNTYIDANGGYRIFEYVVKNYKPTNPGDLGVQFSALGRKIHANIQVQDESSVRAVQIIFEGRYYANKELTSSNKLILKVTNYSDSERMNVDLSKVIRFSGVSGITIPDGQNNNVNIPANSSISFTYNLEGVPHNSGTLTASFIENKDVSGLVSSPLIIEDMPSGEAEVLSIAVEGLYVEGKIIDNSNFISVEIHNKGSEAIKNIDLSQALTLNNSGLTVVNGQHTDVNIDPGQKIILKYELSGVPTGNELIATWNYSTIGIISKSKIITSELYVSPNSISSDNPDIEDTKDIFISAGTGNAWEIDTSSLPSWLELSATSGVGDSNIIAKLKVHDTNEQKYVKIIVRRTSDNAIGEILVSKPANNEIRINKSNLYRLNESYSINGEERIISIEGDVTTTNIKIIEKPEWVESITINNPIPGKMKIKTKERTIPGPLIANQPFAFSYGPGDSYVYSGRLTIRAKAQKCPKVAPLFPHKLTPYLISKYSRRDGNNLRVYVDKILLEESNNPNDKFTNYKLQGNSQFEFDFFTEYGGGKSYLYAIPRLEYYTAGANYSSNTSSNDIGWEATIKILYKTRIDQTIDQVLYKSTASSSYYGRGETLSKISQNGYQSKFFVEEIDRAGQYTSHYYSIDNVPLGIIKACYCMDGKDENTHDTP